MKIAIANSLLEPVGIPWFIREEFHAQRIIDTLHERFADWSRHGWLPTSTDVIKYDAETVRMLLKKIAVKGGGKMVAASSGRLYRDHTCMAHRYTVMFSEPGKSRRHRVCLDDFFK